MHAFTIAAAAVLVGLSNAQTGGNIPGIPECAGGCIGNFGGCGALDADCICNNSDLITNLACCVSVQCDEDDQESKSDSCVASDVPVRDEVYADRCSDFVLRARHLRELRCGSPSIRLLRSRRGEHAAGRLQHGSCGRFVCCNQRKQREHGDDHNERQRH